MKNLVLCFLFLANVSIASNKEFTHDDITIHFSEHDQTSPHRNSPLKGFPIQIEYRERIPEFGQKTQKHKQYRLDTERVDKKFIPFFEKNFPDIKKCLTTTPNGYPGWQYLDQYNETSFNPKNENGQKKCEAMKKLEKFYRAYVTKINKNLPEAEQIFLPKEDELLVCFTTDSKIVESSGYKFFD